MIFNTTNLKQKPFLGLYYLVKDYYYLVILAFKGLKTKNPAETGF